MTAEKKNSWLHTLTIVIPILGALLGFTLRAEHRQTVVEERQDYQASCLSELQKQTAILMRMQARSTAIIEMVEKRHEIEDSRRNR